MDESRRQTAERIVRDTILVVPGKIADRYIDAIEAALNTERERAAKIAESEADGCSASTQQECHLKIAAAIRGKD